ncbi:MAG: hypothetical protein ACRD3H_02630 [Terriglobales bacterium]|jgi:hypothetical protein
MFSASRFKQCRLTLAVSCSLLLAGATGLKAQSPELPAGAVQAKVRTACTECHDSRIILQQRLSKQSWTKEVDKMTKWGALVGADDRAAFIDYLSINFPPEKAAEPAPRVGSTRQK